MIIKKVKYCNWIQILPWWVSSLNTEWCSVCSDGCLQICYIAESCHLQNINSVVVASMEKYITLVSFRILKKTLIIHQLYFRFSYFGNFEGLYFGYPIYIIHLLVVSITPISLDLANVCISFVIFWMWLNLKIIL